ALEINPRLELMPSLDPGDLINSVPGVLRIQAGAGAAILARAQAGDFGRVKVRDREAAGGVILIYVDIGKLLVGDRVAQTGGKSQLRYVKARAGRYRGVLLARIGDAKLAQKVRREVGYQADSRVTGRIRAYCGSGKRLVDQAQREALRLRAG